MYTLLLLTHMTQHNPVPPHLHHRHFLYPGYALNLTKKPLFFVWKISLPWTCWCQNLINGNWNSSFGLIHSWKSTNLSVIFYFLIDVRQCLHADWLANDLDPLAMCGKHRKRKTWDFRDATQSSLQRLCNTGFR